MTDPLEHLHPAYREHARLAEAERIAWIRAERWIRYPQAELALARLADLLSYPPRDRMPCLLLYGDTGMGKTQILRKFGRDHAARFDAAGGITIMPVVAFQMPPEPVEADVYGELLAALGAPRREGGPVRPARDLARRLLAAMGTRMLIVDEVHAMLAGTWRQQRIFLNTLRFLANDLRVVLVCAGTEEARQALLTDPQLAERFEALHLPRWRDDAAFGRLLASFAAILPLRRPSRLDTPEARRRILELTDGVTVRVCRLLETVAVLAIRDGRECLEAASFADDDLVLPLVSMTGKTRRGSRAAAVTAG